ncbi:DNA (cytosine-5)-methyltransferase 3A [Halyomorpha halys]|uniref:DNA (cytosine-5)-methyltransferase 3A n=1 Tax=Halyomorpha halys TaxID=286706 RepID=UPI0006D4E905|nr:DNA (cytosine-5)-methyltransferase 3A-like [Halyomorpha halys]
MSKKALRVLSLFDGISAGYVALQEAGLAVEKYFASEIDEDAIRISKLNSKGGICHLGRIEHIDENIIKEIGPIDLLIGGSPCVDLSLVNPARKGLFDSQGSGKLFFEYIRVLHLVRMQYKNVIFLFENTAAMPETFKDTISHFLECAPIKINAKAFSPQIRARYFWGNISNMQQLKKKVDTTNIRLASFLNPFCNRVAVVDKIRTITTNSNSLSQGRERIPAVLMDGEYCNLWITEIERIFGFPTHYTDVGNISLRKRLLLLGNSWSVATVKEIFYSLRNQFKTA